MEGKDFIYAFYWQTKIAGMLPSRLGTKQRIVLKHKMKRVFLYAHGGSGNHGCEAIVRSTLGMLQREKAFICTLISKMPKEDIDYGIDQLCEIIQEQEPYSRLTLSFAKAYLHLKLAHDYVPLDKLYYKKAFDHIRKGDIALSIGGDNYCYADVKRYTMMHDMLLQRGAKTVLWGCSVEPSLLADSAIAQDISRYSLITARESISYEALRAVNPHTVLVPDPAFTLECHVPTLPEGFMDGNMVGINVSPMAIENESSSGMVLANFQALIDYILAETDMGVALIPHVIWDFSDDRVPLRKLYQKHQHTGRVVMVEDHNCMELKGIISRCRFFIGARTHATIAAYSTGVPTLVVGYSVKARGIARDLFNTEDGYVLPVQHLKEKGELLTAFKNIMHHENTVRKALCKEEIYRRTCQYTNIFNTIFRL